jgi:hypothetical protein
MSIQLSLLIALLLAAPGLRLLRLAMQERREPELWLGLSFVLTGAGLGLRLFSAQLVAPESEASFVLPNLAGHFGIAFGAFFLYVFVSRVFHPTSAFVRRLIAVVGLALVADLGWMIQSGGHLLEDHPSILAANILRGAVLPWVFVESLRYRAMMLRRIALGIGDPVVANRFTLWAIWSGALSVLPIFVLIARVMASQEAGPREGMMLTVLPIVRLLALSGVSSAVVCIWLSFFPPNFYLARLRRAVASS